MRFETSTGECARVDIMGGNNDDENPTCISNEEGEPQVVKQSMMMSHSPKSVGKKLMGDLEYTQRVKVDRSVDSPDSEMVEQRVESTSVAMRDL